jgi:hypothetical protein
MAKLGEHEVEIVEMCFDGTKSPENTKNKVYIVDINPTRGHDVRNVVLLGFPAPAFRTIRVHTGIRLANLPEMRDRQLSDGYIILLSPPCDQVVLPVRS